MKLQSFFAGAFAGEGFWAITLGDKRVLCGVPAAVINAVQDADDILSALLEYAVETETLFWGHYLLCVARTDRGNFIGVDERPLEKIYPAENSRCRGVNKLRSRSKSASPAPRRCLGSPDCEW